MGIQVQIYEFIPYEGSVLWGCDPKYKSENHELFTGFFQYQLCAIYDIPEIMTVGEVRTKLLDPALDKIINHPTTLANI